jgi:hypothetical protein
MVATAAKLLHDICELRSDVFVLRLKGSRMTAGHDWTSFDSRHWVERYTHDEPR